METLVSLNKRCSTSVVILHGTRSSFVYFGKKHIKRLHFDFSAEIITQLVYRVLKKNALHAAAERSDSHRIVLALVHLICLAYNVKLFHFLVALKKLKLNWWKPHWIRNSCQLRGILDRTFQVVFDCNLAFWSATQKRRRWRRRACYFVLV